MNLGGHVDPAAVEALHLPVIEETERAENSTMTVMEGEVPQKKGVGMQELPKAEVEEGGQAKEGAVAFSFSDSFPPIPAKLVGKVVRGDFVDMAELLRDNIEAERRCGHGDEGSSRCGSSSSHRRPPRREVPDILSWCQCFGIYVSIVATKQPERVPKMLAYQAMLVREARRCGGGGWKPYDTTFRQQAAGNRAVDWSSINSSLYATTFLAQSTGKGTSCDHCTETDHTSDACAAAPVQERCHAGGTGAVFPPRPGYELSRDGRGTLRGRPRKPYPNREDAIRREETACFSFNDGRCRFPGGCRFRHICLKCHSEDHPAVRCPHYPGQAPPRREGQGRQSGWRLDQN